MGLVELGREPLLDPLEQVPVPAERCEDIGVALARGGPSVAALP